MRNFEEDFEYEFEKDVSATRLRNFRIDNHRPVTFEKDWQNDVERQARVKAHQERVQSEMKALGISHERNCT